MIKLHGSWPMFGCEDASPFVVKLMIIFKMGNIPYERLNAIPHDGPKGKIPFISCENGEIIGDTYFIRKYLEENYKLDLDKNLDEKGRALSHIIEKYCDNHLYWIEVYQRWLIDENFEKGPKHFFDAIPENMREAMMNERRSHLGNIIKGLGLTSHSHDEIMQIAKDDIDKISMLLGDNLFILGNEPCGADAAIFANLSALASEFSNTKTREYIVSKPNLLKYLKRINEMYFPNS